MKTKQQLGFTIVEIMIVVAIIGLLAAIAIPNFIKARQNSQRNECLGNLDTIVKGKATWAMEHGATNAPTASDLFGPNLYVLEMPKCPVGGSYTLNGLGVKPTCSVAGHVLSLLRNNSSETVYVHPSLTYTVLQMDGSSVKIVSEEFNLPGWGMVRATATVRLSEGVTLQDGDRFQLSGKQPLAEINSLEELKLLRLSPSR